MSTNERNETFALYTAQQRAPSSSEIDMKADREVTLIESWNEVYIYDSLVILYDCWFGKFASAKVSSLRFQVRRKNITQTCISIFFWRIFWKILSIRYMRVCHSASRNSYLRRQRKLNQGCLFLSEHSTVAEEFWTLGPMFVSSVSIAPKDDPLRNCSSPHFQEMFLALSIKTKCYFASFSSGLSFIDVERSLL